MPFSLHLTERGNIRSGVADNTQKLLPADSYLATSQSSLAAWSKREQAGRVDVYMSR